MIIRQLLGAFLITFLLFTKTVGRRIEGYFFPATSTGVIVDHIRVGDTWTRIWGHAARLRECSFEHLVWYIGRDGQNVPVGLILEEDTMVRSDDGFDFGPWSIQLTLSQLLSRSYAVVYHRCHRFWLTETRFYR